MNLLKKLAPVEPQCTNIGTEYAGKSYKTDGSAQIV